MSFIGRGVTLALTWLRNRFHAKSATFAPVSVIEVAETAAPEPLADPPPGNAREEAPKAQPARTFRRDILDRLDEYMTYIKRMKKSNPEAYALYTKVGAHLPPDGPIVDTQDLEGAFLRNMPSFGAIAWGDGKKNDDPNVVPLRFTYFQKYSKGPLTVQRQADDEAIYTVGVYLDDAEDKKLSARGTGGIFEFHIALKADGRARLLLELVTQRQEIAHRTGPDRGYKTMLVRQRWGVPTRLAIFGEDDPIGPAQRAIWIFRITANAWTMSEASALIRIQAKKGNLAVAFSVDTENLPGFFSDRDAVLSRGGRRAPIFHIVRPHRRRLANGREIGVRAHFAGLRRFTWNGYTVLMTVPGKHHVPMFEWGLGSVASDAHLAEGRSLTDTIAIEDVAGALAKHIEGVSIRDAVASIPKAKVAAR